MAGEQYGADGEVLTPVGGEFNSTPPTLVDGQDVGLQFDNRGALLTRVAQGATLAAVGASSDGNAAGNAGLYAMSYPHIFNGTSWDRVRTPNVFKRINAGTAITAGTGITAWTPTAGKKFRLMGWVISVDAIAQLIFGDNLVGAELIRTEKLLTATDKARAGWPELGNGILSAAANNVLKIDATAACNIAGFVFGTEE